MAASKPTKSARRIKPESDPLDWQLNQLCRTVEEAYSEDLRKMAATAAPHAASGMMFEIVKSGWYETQTKQSADYVWTLTRAGWNDPASQEPTLVVCSKGTGEPYVNLRFARPE